MRVSQPWLRPKPRSCTRLLRRKREHGDVKAGERQAEQEEAQQELQLSSLGRELSPRVRSSHEMPQGQGMPHPGGPGLFSSLRAELTGTVGGETQRGGHRGSEPALLLGPLRALSPCPPWAQGPAQRCLRILLSKRVI